MRRILLLLIVVFSFNQTKGQTKQDALNALRAQGVTLEQAQKLALANGLLPDTKSSKSNVVKANDVVTDLKVTAVKKDSIIPPKPAVVVQVEKNTEKYFGYDIFVNNPFGTKDYLLGNIDEGYILAPGDELRITVFGDNNLEFVSKIDLNGNISFPNLGVFFAAGNSFATLKKRVNVFLGKFYSGLLSNPSRTFLDVSLTQIRPVKVSVLGNVNTPGPHLVNGMATVLNALYASGGINKSGTLREVKVYRNNKLIKSIDLYDYITQGNIDQDIRLSNNDVIFVGPRLSSVTLTGNVKKNAIYELKPNESLKDLLKYSGGLSASASLDNMNISRIKPFDNRKQELVFNRFLTTVNYSKYRDNSKNNFLLTDGDVVLVKGILEKQKNTVSIAGNVYSPGTFALDTYSDLKTLIISGANGLKPKTYLEKIDINSVDEKGVLSYQTFKLSSVLDGEITVTLKENDGVKIYSLEEVEGAKTASISGYGVTPKTVSITENLSLYDLIFQSVSYDELEFQSKVLTSRLDLNRFDSNTGLYSTIQFDFDDTATLKTTFLKAKDKVTLYAKTVTEDLSPTVTIGGQVNNAGEFSLSNNMYLEDLIIKAGGFTKTAVKDYVFVNRLDRDLGTGKYSQVKVNDLDIEYMLGNKDTPSNPFILENYDIVNVVAPIRANFQPVVSVQGEVKFPRNVILETDQITIGSLIESVGGLTNNSNLESSYVERDGLKLYVSIEKMLLDSKTTLQNGDILFIGSKLNSVTTTGAVEMPTAFNWEPGKKAKYYIKASGGKKEGGIESKYVVHASGKTEKISFFKNPKIYPGSEIVLVQKDRKEWSERFKDSVDKITNTFTILTSTLTTILLITKL
ncbi:SLBB domain-containing protein [Polaribacter sp.]|nr:SLBB domain-containing protein [Polaribacter sp.]MDC1519840.1 SLBB domain-containing protein [Polaribacter sp.]